MYNIINEEMTRNVCGMAGASHDEVMKAWKDWCAELVKIQQEDGCEHYSDMEDCFFPAFADGATPQEAWDDEKSYASGDIDV